LNYNFEWDPIKARKNYQKHKISFERASEIFLDPIALSIYDKEHSNTEDRWITIGKTKSEIIIVVIHTFQEIQENNIRIRIISARKATKHEKIQYQGN
jgi:uncharacterized DUF497 family protein